MDDDVYIYQTGKIGLKEVYQMYEVYKIIEDGAPIVKQIGYWSNDSNLLYFVEQDKNSRRADLGASIILSCF